MAVYSKSFIVAANQTARVLGSGDLDVLATPALIAMVENTAKVLLAKVLTVEETSVGTKIDMVHRRPSAVGAEITVNVKQETEKQVKVDFSFDVYEGSELIAKGSHQRAVVVTEDFLSRL
ncbi:hypothetical protein [uncultured Enterococcus sp.]|uniref:thioesterase family protein n=1 Tax=uncultured Enterococcus sp. TaxID=167972 RepID=UPI002AA67D52|nr:hypothetical protein [uncultured Enterococcus sp.]